MPRERTCSYCGGSGTVVRWYTDKNGKSQKEETTCPTCNGRGTV